MHLTAWEWVSNFKLGREEKCRSILSGKCGENSGETFSACHLNCCLSCVFDLLAGKKRICKKNSSSIIVFALSVQKTKHCGENMWQCVFVLLFERDEKYLRRHFFGQQFSLFALGAPVLSRRVKISLQNQIYRRTTHTVAHLLSSKCPTSRKCASDAYSLLHFPQVT